MRCFFDWNCIRPILNWGHGGLHIVETHRVMGIVPSGHLTVCYGKLPFLVSFPIQNCDLNHIVMFNYQRVNPIRSHSTTISHGFPMVFPQLCKRLPAGRDPEIYGDPAQDMMVHEPCAITCRVAPSFLRVGHMDLFARRATVPGRSERHVTVEVVVVSYTLW